MSLPDLHQVTGRPQPESAARLSVALAEAARPETAPDESLRLDRVVLEALEESLDPDALLGEIDIDTLGAWLQRGVDRLSDAGEPPPLELRAHVWAVLDALRRPAVVRRLDRPAVSKWADRFLAAVEASQLTVGPLFRQRASAYGSKVLFDVPGPGGLVSLTWRDVASRVDTVARGLLSLGAPEDVAPIAMLSDNRIEMALVDLACLGSGLMNVVVPANATESDVGFILRHAGVRTVVVAGRNQLHKVQKHRAALPFLTRVVVLDRAVGPDEDSIPFAELETRAEQVPQDVPRKRGEAACVDDVATMMYTSGTTGTPKGIQFSQRNIVFKRFARGLALPEIGENDVFLSYLPLFHTFGRYLEMLGCVFWGARYCFLLDPSVEALIDGMRRHRPTVFISVPRKWMQLYEAIADRADPLEASDEAIADAVHDVTGGRLRWGLSAAGYLDPDVFRFFHRYGVQLLSGFGMSEATGGITMTPPFEYREDSLGVALPGIEVKIADDGELLIRGPYVMKGYLDPPDHEPAFDPDGWFHSGDLMVMDQDEHLRLVDRKKEIYKNEKGQTIAPQRIENLFREFESVGRVFLVGDHRPYNTLLVYPNPDYRALDLSALAPQDIRDHFRSLIASVNKFVAPFERIVDFDVIGRDLDPNRGELTPKGTPRRKTVVENFADVIEAMYRRTSLHVGGVEVTVPNWFLQYLGLTAGDVRTDGEVIRISSLDTTLAVRRLGDGGVQIGSCIYDGVEREVNLGVFLATPRLWLGNEQLVDFAPLDMGERQRPAKEDAGIEWTGRATPYAPREDDRDRLEASIQHSEWDLSELDRAARMLSSSDDEGALAAVRLLERVVANEDGVMAEPARTILARGAAAVSEDVRRRAFQILVPTERIARLPAALERFFGSDPLLMDSETSASLCERSLPDEKTEAFITFAERACTGTFGGPSHGSLAQSLLSFLADYGAAHPARYQRIRAFLVRMSLFAGDPEARLHAGGARHTLDNGFRLWLGPTSRIAVDTETGQEYRWEDVIVFEEGMPDEHRRRLLSAIKNTPFLREAVFLFYRGPVIRLNDVPPGGVWIRQLGTRHGKVVYRITIQTRAQESYEAAANLNETLSAEQVQEEIDWLILCGLARRREPVVEAFGGYLPDQDLWSEEYIPGDTLDRELRRLSRRSDQEEGLQQLWPFLAWSALSAFVDFWERSGELLEIAELSPTDIVLPTRDYHTGSRIVSLSARRPHQGLLKMLQSFKNEFVDPVQAQYPELDGLVGWDLVFSSFVEVVGEQTGLSAYEAVLEGPDAPPELTEALRAYVTTVRQRGFLPMRLFFAAKRYRRWAELSEGATPQARASTLQEFYDTYGLDRLVKAYPEVRLRFFRETVFRDSPAAFRSGLDELIARVRSSELKAEEIPGAVADLRSRVKVEPDDDYFLARIPFAYVRPEDTVDFVSSDVGGSSQSEIVMTLEDADGNPFRVRHALLPKEVERLHRLFLAAKLDVRFRPEHLYLLAINDRDQIVGGIYYEMRDGGDEAHLEKIVVAESYRRKGVADGLMREFFNRLRAGGAKRVTTGFFRPEYFYAHGFTIEGRYAGLVKSLVAGADGSRQG